jgi:hypothetical protein
MQHQKIEIFFFQNLGENILNIWHQNVEPARATTACILFHPWKLALQKSMRKIATIEWDVSKHLILQKKVLLLENNTNTYFILCFCFRDIKYIHS